jgi:hypothetical protein
VSRTDTSGEVWAESVGLSPADLQRLPLMVTALIDALDASEDCGCAWRALSDNYAKSEWLLPERDSDGRLSREFVLAELEALFRTITTITRLAGARLDQEGRAHGCR